ncbi:rhamnulose-1-phosphate aldolase [Candidatus Fermentibacteria bacterium]|nr:rhamnulose-1-phosphate aldolase [Candidatus Fermentibacteria bacterium]
MSREDLGEDVLRELDKVSEVAAHLWERGWAERNGGNISVDLTAIADRLPTTPDAVTVTMKDLPREAGGRTLFVTGAGERLRDLRPPMRAGGIVRFDDAANGYRVLWSAGGPSGFRATSELPSHLRIHLDLSSRNGEHRAVVHCHPTDLLALSHHPRFGIDEELLTRTLWAMLPEVRVFVPSGIAIAPYALPGSSVLAELTVEGLRKADVVLWSKHGAVAMGGDVREAFDLIDVAEKGAAILLRCLSAGYDPVGLSDDQLRELERKFDL